MPLLEGWIPFAIPFACCEFSVQKFYLALYYVTVANFEGKIYCIYIVCEFFGQLQFFVLDVCLLQVETILDKETFMLEELLDEDEIIQECKALNGRLINL